MGTTITKGDTFGGIPMRKIRDVLLAMNDRPYDDFGVSALRKVDMEPGAVTALRSEFRRRDLIHDRDTPHRRTEGYLTASGRGLAKASGTGKVHRSRAQAVLDALLKRAAENNENPDRCHDVTEIWLFGSHARGEEFVGDVDLVILTEPVQEAHDRFEALSWDERYRFARSLLSDTDMNSIMAGSDGWVLDKMTRRRLMGPRRSSLIARHQIFDLLSLHVPCRLVFSIDHGGIHDGPLLPHHPDSIGRADHVPEPLTMPDLTAHDMPADLFLEGLIDPSHHRTWLHRRVILQGQFRPCATFGALKTYRPFGTRIGDFKRARKLNPNAWAGDLALMGDGRTGIEGVARFSHRWQRGASIAVSNLSLTIGGCRSLGPGHGANVVSHLLHLCSTIVHLAKVFTWNDVLEIRLEACNRLAGRVLDDLSRYLTVSPHHVVTGARIPETIILDDVEVDTTLLEGVILVFEGQGPASGRRLDLGAQTRWINEIDGM